MPCAGNQRKLLKYNGSNCTLVTERAFGNQGGEGGAFAPPSKDRSDKRSDRYHTTVSDLGFSARYNTSTICRIREILLVWCAKIRLS